MSVAAPAAAFRLRSTLQRLVLDASLEIGAGGEAVVWHVPGGAGLVAKLYHDPAIERARKIARMLAHPPAMPAGTAIAWPTDLLLDGRGGFAGFVMPLAGGPRVFEFYNPVTRRATAPGFHAGLLHRAGRNLAAAFDALHAPGYVVGDVNESNVIVSPTGADVTLVDADSLQVRDEDGAVHRSRVGKAEFTPPELQGVDFGEVDRTPEHDRFGLAVLLFLLLMEGTHPFAARFGGDDAPPVEERTGRGLFPHAPGSALRPPRMAPRFDALDPALQAMFARAFVHGHADPSARPTAAEWCGALAAAQAALVACPANPRHLFAPHVNACPWCARARLLGGRDPFPAHLPAVVAVPSVRRRRATPGTTLDAPDVPAATGVTVSPFGVRGPARQATRGPAASMGLSAPSLSPFGLARAAAPVPKVFGLSGILNPLVALLPALAVMAVARGNASALAVSAVVALVAVGLLGAGLWQRIRASTMWIALAAMFAAAALAAFPAGSAGSAAMASDGAAGPDTTVVVETTHEADAVGTPPVNPTAEQIADVVARPGHAAPRVPPPLPDATPDVDAGNDAVPAHDVDVRPVLIDTATVAWALGTFYGTTTGGGATAEPDTAVMWLRVGTTGRVLDDDGEVINSTSETAASAARAVLPYLRFAPAVRDGHVVRAWVSQRFIFPR